jgi:hypothetical protein
MLVLNGVELQSLDETPARREINDKKEVVYPIDYLVVSSHCNRMYSQVLWNRQ